MTIEEISAKLDELISRGEIRMREVGGNPVMLGMCQTALDWLTPEEKEERLRLVLSLPSQGQLAAEARERLLAKHKARKANRIKGE